MLSTKARPKVETEVMVHCQSCRDLFTMDVTLKGRRILQFDPTSHMIVPANHHLRCHCGGHYSFFSVCPPVE